MARSMNRVTLIGNLGRDAEVSTMRDGGSKRAVLRVATTETWKDRNTGEKREATEWHQVVIFGDGLIDALVEPYFKRGLRVLIEGQLKTRKWQDQEGRDRYATEVVVSPFRGQVMPLGGVNGSRDSGGGDYGGGYDGGGDPGGSRPDIDDDIPF